MIKYRSWNGFLIFLCFVCVNSLAEPTLADTALYNQLKVPGGVVSLEWNSEFSDQEKIFLQQWLTKATHTASQLAGQFPRTESRIIIERANPARRSTSRWPVPWGQTIRSGLEGVSFSVNTDKPMSEFVEDWTAAHEFSHLFIPYPGQRDIWLSEGFASYYQNILMAREGLLSEQRAWQKLYEGYMRAETDRNEDVTLNEVSQDRRRLCSQGKCPTMRVYWSGALFFMEADIALRKASNNQRSLDWVLNQYIECCRDKRNRWSGKQMLASFDQVLEAEELIGSSMERQYFTNLYQRYSQSRKIPDCEPLFKQIGIDIVEGQVNLDGDLNTIAMRQDFTRARLEPVKMESIELD